MSFSAAAAATFGTSGDAGRWTSPRHDTARRGRTGRCNSTEQRPSRTGTSDTRDTAARTQSPEKVQQEKVQQKDVQQQMQSETAQNEKGKNVHDEVPTNTSSQKKGHSVTESPRKRKSDNKGTQPGLNLPVHGSLVPTGLVHDRLAQLGNTLGRVGETREVQKKQRISINRNARSAAATDSSPRRAP